jgi:hypothetical protein
MAISLPDAGQYDTENVGPWALLPSHELAQHLTTISADWQRHRLDRRRIIA